MTDSEIKRLSECMKDNRLCGINRDMIDDLTTFGFPVALSENLVLVANVYNFNILSHYIFVSGERIFTADYRIKNVNFCSCFV